MLKCHRPPFATYGAREYLVRVQIRRRLHPGVYKKERLLLLNSRSLRLFRGHLPPKRGRTIPVESLLCKQFTLGSVEKDETTYPSSARVVPSSEGRLLDWGPLPFVLKERFSSTLISVRSTEGPLRAPWHRRSRHRPCRIPELSVACSLKHKGLTVLPTEDTRLVKGSG